MIFDISQREQYRKNHRFSQIQKTEGIAAAYPKMQLMRRSSKLGRIEESDSEDDSTDDNKDESHSESDSDSSSDTW